MKMDTSISPIEKKDLIIVGGFNIFPREIDELIYAHPKVKEGIAVGIPDDYSGERIKAYITLKEGKTATPEEFITYFREKLTPYKVAIRNTNKENR